MPTESTLFDRMTQMLARSAGLDELEARSTLQLALKRLVYDPRTITVPQMETVIDRALPEELRARGVGSPEAIGRALRTALKESQTDGDARKAPEEIFRRLLKR